MASGRSHDRATWVLALPFGALWWPWLGLTGSAVAAFCFLLGGLWLSPDLDTRSNATRRWGPLKLLWWPYRRVLSHRSLISHTPLIGSGVRLLYLFALVLGLGLLLQPLGAPAPTALIGDLQKLWLQQRPLLITALIAVEASAWLHLIQDGDPQPRLPRLLRMARRRSRRRSRH
jgi:uncharacterized metal-binding protein